MTGPPCQLLSRLFGLGERVADRLSLRSIRQRLRDDHRQSKAADINIPFTRIIVIHGDGGGQNLIGKAGRG